jgi:hypothetical protein
LVIGLFKAELTKPLRALAHRAERATLEYVDWFNHRRLCEACGDIPPAELETACCRQNAALFLPKRTRQQPESPDSRSGAAPAIGMTDCGAPIPHQDR